MLSVAYSTSLFRPPIPTDSMIRRAFDYQRSGLRSRHRVSSVEKLLIAIHVLTRVTNCAVAER
ncbi:TPA: hypothetical protein N0F65_001034 [Lagenidium giganteum]|uniref:Uncharacterized protein n=1 Tax=Lagenidium giganteum TaxID=4803 RepID=A0AAV2YUN3_9STRA|nr:TPA: hypothetical protein N0F65_001034 [Lagenidium giganteum]